MTETKCIFPKQPQSVTVLAFITVLIVLLLILTVMVHMRNRKLKSTLEEQMAERRLLDKICADFTAVYYVESYTGSFGTLSINDGTNVKKWDESGNVTHVCKIREELRRFRIKLKLGKRHVKYDDEK